MKLCQGRLGKIRWGCVILGMVMKGLDNEDLGLGNINSNKVRLGEVM